MKSILTFLIVIVTIVGVQPIYSQQTAGLDMVVKPTKADKKMAKQYANDGWTAAVGTQPLETQLAVVRLMMSDKDLDGSNRYYYHTNVSKGNTYNMAYNAARANAVAELASLTETRIASEFSSYIDESQSQDNTSITSEAFMQQASTIVNACIRDVKPVLIMSRQLNDRTVEVTVGIILDRVELTKRLRQGANATIPNNN